jgi:hypothetical protein
MLLNKPLETKYSFMAALIMALCLILITNSINASLTTSLFLSALLLAAIGGITKVGSP